jgi:hypothetical protein
MTEAAAKEKKKIYEGKSLVRGDSWVNAPDSVARKRQMVLTTA